MSKREADERIEPDGNAGLVKVTRGSKPEGKKSAGLAKSNSSFIDSSLTWNDLAWLRRITKLPILLKGVQRAEDVLIAMNVGLWDCREQPWWQSCRHCSTGNHYLVGTPPALS
jgi:L-lactate dehydrogenase (cytochrome)